MQQLCIIRSTALLATLFALFIATPRSNPIEQQRTKGEDENLKLVFKQYLEREFKLRPMEATSLGDHRFDDRLEDVSPAARKKWLAFYRATLARLPKTVNYKKLSRDNQIDYEILAHHLKTRIWLMENFDPFAEDPRIYNYYIVESVYSLLSRSTLPKAVNIRNCAKRMLFIPRIIEAAKKNIQNPAKVKVETAIRQTRGAISFYETGIYRYTGETPALSELRPRAKAVVKHLRGYLKYLEKEVLPRAKDNWRIGKKKFAKKLDFVLNTGVTSEQVLQNAEDEFARVTDEMYVIARQLWHKFFPGKAMPPADEKGRRKIIRMVLDIVGKEHGKAENLVRDIQTGVEGIKKFIRDKKILSLPEPDRCKIIEMPEFKRGNSIAYLNSAPPLDQKVDSFYAISPPPKRWTAKRAKTFMEEYNPHMLLVLSIHEAYPGHYVQLEYSNRHPSLIRRVLQSGIFAEGWAVYTEKMMLDQGFGEGSLELRLNQLKFYLRAVGNAILDYKMHCTDMSDEEALRFLIELVFQSEAEAVLKVIRAKQSSCQLSTYFVGRMAFVRLRERVQNKLGERFDLGQYHEAVLSHGTLPVRYLPELVMRHLKIAE